MNLNFYKLKVMNSPNGNMSENIVSPMTEAENLQNEEAKHWNKSFLDKKSSGTSPKMEHVPPSISPSHMQKAFPRQNGISTKKKLRLEDEEYDSLDMTCNLAPDMNDDCDAFGKHIAAQLRLMTKMQKFMAQRLMSEICFRGQIQHLSLSTNVVNTPVQQHQPAQQQPQQMQPTQPHLPTSMFATHRPPHIPSTMFGRSPEYLLLHQQGIRPSNAIPSFQNFMQPQQDHSTVPLESVG